MLASGPSIWIGGGRAQGSFHTKSEKGDNHPLTGRSDAEKTVGHVGQGRGTVMVFDEDALPLTRSWCLER